MTWTLLSRLLSEALRASRGLTILVVMAAGCAAMAPTTAVIAVGAAVGGVVAPPAPGPLSPAGWALLAGTMFVLRWAAGTVQHTAAGALGDRIDGRLQRRLMSAVLKPESVIRLAHREHQALVAAGRSAFSSEGIRPGQLISNLTGLFVGRTTLTGACVVLMFVHPLLGCVLLIAGLWAAYEDKASAREEAGHHYGSTEDARRTEYYLQLGLRPAVAAEVRIFGLGNFLRQRYDQSWEKSMISVFAPAGWRNVAATMTLSAAVLLCLAGILVAALDAKSGAGVLAAAVLALMAGLDGMRQSSWTGLQTEQAAAVFRRYLDALRREPPSEPGIGEVPVGDIRFERVTFSYPDGPPVLRDVNLTIEAGRSLAIVGANGAGKSTLIKLLCRFLEPTSGRITVGGVDIATIDLRTWWGYLAVVMQDSSRFGLTASDEVGWGSVEDSDDRTGLEASAGAAGIRDKIERLPLGWDTPLSAQFTDGVELSGGEWQLTALARALFSVRHGSSLLVLDEPAAQLDARSEGRLFDHLLTVGQGVTTIIVSHRFSTVRQAESIVVIGDGGVQEQGTHDELLAAGRGYATMFRLQADRYDLGSPR